MRSAFDFSPLFRSTIGFDQLPGILETASRMDEASLGYPPYNIEKLGEDAYRISMAVAGFALEDLSIEAKDRTLEISGSQDEQQAERTFLHRGIAARSFRRVFQLADHVKVADAHLENGLLHIELVREIPEEKKPRQIAIGTAERKRLSAADEKVSKAA